MTDLVAQRFDCEAVLSPLQIGLQLYGDQFHLEKGGDSLQPSGDLSVTDQP